MSTANVITVKGRYASNGGGDIPCLADVSNLIEIALRPQGTVTPPDVGEFLTCYLDDIGAVSGTVADPCGGGFALRVATNAERSARIAARLTWLRNSAALKDQRQAARIIPIHRDVRIKGACGFEIEALVADLSRTGAALELDGKLEIGEAVTVGKRFATVVRHTPDGIGVAFRLPFGAMTFNEHVVI